MLVIIITITNNYYYNCYCIVYVEDITWLQGDKLLFESTLRLSNENQQNTFQPKNGNDPVDEPASKDAFVLHCNKRNLAISRSKFLYCTLS